MRKALWVSMIVVVGGLLFSTPVMAQEGPFVYAYAELVVARLDDDTVLLIGIGTAEEEDEGCGPVAIDVTLAGPSGLLASGNASEECAVSLDLEVELPISGWEDGDYEAFVEVTSGGVGGHVKVRNFRQASTAVTGVSVSWSVAVSG